jgi:hypothetical protein
MSRTRKVDGHTIEIGQHLDGKGKRVYLDGNDVTEKVLRELGPRTESRGMPVPHGDQFVLDWMERKIKNSEIP